MTGEHTVKRYDEELDALQALVMRMGGLVEEQVARAVEALREGDEDLASEVESRELTVNLFEVQIDETAVGMLARRQPMGRDLRAILAFSKVASDLERIGDEARTIARNTRRVYEVACIAPAPTLVADVPRMANAATDMLRDALGALARLDVAAAIEVQRADRALDDLFRSALRRLASWVLEDPRNVGHGIEATFVLKSIERVGDHAKNVAEHVVFLVEGKDVRHVGVESLAEAAARGE